MAPTTPMWPQYHFSLKTKRFLPRQRPFHPTFLVCVLWIERGQGLRQTPEFRVTTSAIPHYEPFQGRASAGGKQDHTLMHAIKRGITGLTRVFSLPVGRQVAPGRLTATSLYELGKNSNWALAIFPLTPALSAVPLDHRLERPSFIQCSTDITVPAARGS